MEMFNTYHAGNQSIKINAVSGTLVKNHKKSRFVIARQNSSLFDPSKPQLTHKPHYAYVQEDAMVLQAMLLPDGNFLCEVLLVKDMDGDGNA